MRRGKGRIERGQVLRVELEALVEGERSTRTSDLVEFSDEVLERLRDLGYLDAPDE